MSLSMLNRIIEQIKWKSVEKRKTIILIDETFGELIKWQDIKSTCVDIVLDLGASADDITALKTFQPERILFLVADAFSKESVNRFKLVIVASSSPECIIYTSTSPESIPQSLRFENKEPYVFLQDFLQPSSVSVYYFPLHSFDLIKCAPNQHEVQFQVLSSHKCRDMKPLTLNRIEESQTGGNEYTSVNEVVASDLPSDVKSELKTLSHELAGAIVFDLGLDPSSSLFALGKTASLLGHNILPILENCVKLRTVGQEAAASGATRHQQGLRVRTALSDNHTDAVRVASLVLVDRCEDLFTPSSHGGQFPLAHRVVSTLKHCLSGQHRTAGGRRIDGMCDVDITPLSLQAPTLSHDTSQLGVKNTREKLLLPMSGVGNLSIQLAPTLCYRYEADSFVSREAPATSGSRNEILFHLMTASEDIGRQSLCAELRRRVLLELGSDPPAKKRGLGAEVLAYTQALVDAPGKTAQRASTRPRVGFSMGTCLRSQGLLSVSLAVVEAMQRSSGKQFAAICDWQCAFDVRGAREAVLEKIAAQHCDLDICVAHLMTYFAASAAPIASSLSRTGSALKMSASASTASLDSVGNDRSLSDSANSSPVKKAKSSIGGESGKARDPSRSGGTAAKEKENHCFGPVDVTHLLLQLLRLVSLFRYRDCSGFSLDSFLICLTDYLLNKSPVPELDYLLEMGFLTPDARNLLDEFRALGPGAGGAASEDLQEAVAVRVVGAMRGFSEFSALVATARQLSVSKGRLSDAAKHLDLLGDLNRPRLSSGIAGDDDSASAAEVAGLVGRLSQAFLARRSSCAAPVNQFYNREESAMDGAYLSSLLECVESPLEQMKRAGMGLLSMGLGRLGFGGPAVVSTSAPHPGDQETMVIFVVGGVSYKEVGQVRAVLDRHYLETKGKTAGRVIIMSTKTLNPENVFHIMYNI